MKSFFAVLFLLTSFLAYATPIISDENLTIGNLKNGLTYYLYESNDEETTGHDEKISFRLYVDIGSFEESDDQKGYAHLFEQIGHRDGRYFTFEQKEDHIKLNKLVHDAYTTYDRTVYGLDDPNPTTKSIEDSLKYLYDFAAGAYVTENDVEVERDIVLEELRLKELDEDSLQEKLLRITDNGQYLKSKNSIGTRKILNAATQQSVRKFLDKWYQPQHMNLIITGQIDTQKVEQQIIDLFGDIKSVPAPKQAAPIFELPIGTHFVTADDVRSEEVNILIPMPHYDAPVVDVNTYYNQYYQNLITGVSASQIKFNNGMVEKIVPNIDVYYVREQKRNYLNVRIAHETGKRLDALQFGLSQLAILRQYGFGLSHFDKNVSQIEKIQEKPYSNLKKDGRPSKIADQIIFNLANDAILISEDTEKQQITDFLAQLNSADVAAKLHDVLQNKAAVIVVSRTEVEKREQEKAQILIDSFNQQTITVIKPQEDIGGATKLAKINVPPGKIIKEQTFGTSPIVQLTLSNGANAYLLNRKQDKGHISVVAYAQGGKEVLSDKQNIASGFFIPAIESNGLGGLNITELSDYLLAARFNMFSYFLNKASHGFKLEIEKTESLEDALKLMHMSFYQASIDTKKLDFMRDSAAQSVKQWQTTPNGEFAHNVFNAIYKSGKARFDVTPKMFDAISKNDLEQIYNKLYSDLSKFHFVLVGDFENDQAKILLEKYIANIPSQKITTSLVDITYYPKNIEVRSNNNPLERSNVSLSYHNPEFEKNYDNQVALLIGARIFSDRVYQIMREKEGLTYTLDIHFLANSASVQNAEINMKFAVDPNNEKRALEIIDTEIKNLTDKPITQHEFDEQLEQFLKSYKQQFKFNSSAANEYASELAHGKNINQIVDLVDIIKSVKLQNVQIDMTNFFKNSLRIEQVFSNQDVPE